MHLVMFDIDGTLTQTYGPDERCFVRALDEVFGFTDINTDWASYTHCSDSGILDELFRGRLGRCPSEAEIAACQARFISLLTEASAQQPFRQVPGANALLSRLAGASDYAIAVASGAWECSARLKLAHAGVEIAGFPAAFSDQAHAREDIMRNALSRAAKFYAQSCFDSVTYIGDGVWDGRASRALGFSFIGIAAEDRAQKLLAEGAQHIFVDYSDSEAFLSAFHANRRAANRSPVTKQ